MDRLSMRLATSADEPVLMGLRAEAEEWLAAAGIDQWRTPGVRDRALAKWQVDIVEGRTWIAVGASSAPVATVTLARPDQDFWHETDTPDSALYVAKLITARATAGQHVGGRVLDWVAGVARARQLPWVRLDVWRTNRRLQQYYLTEGFSHVRTEAPSHRLSGWMAQRPAALVMHPENPIATPSGADQEARSA